MYANVCYASVPPKIDRSALPKMAVKVGQLIHFDVPVAGEPPPKVLVLSYFLH